MPPQCSIESKIQDLYTWLKAEPELDVRSMKYDDIVLNCLPIVYSFIYMSVF